MKRRILLLIIISSSVLLQAQDNTEWYLYTFGKICSLSIPSSMECRDTTSYTGEFINNGIKQRIISFGLDLPDQRIVFQPKGLNSSDPEVAQAANSKYSRIIIELLSGEGISQSDVNALSLSDMEEVNDVFYNNYKSDLQRMGKDVSKFVWYPIEKVKYSERNALVLHFLRPGLQGAVNVREYRFFFGERQMRIVVSYREEEKHLWESDFTKVINTLKFR